MADMEKKLPQLVMILSVDHRLPALELLPGYSVRSLRHGEEEVWEDIIQQSFNKTYVFAKRMATDPCYSPERVLFICDEQQRPVATASAWHRSVLSDDTGYLHMVGVLPSYGGRGLGLQISLAAVIQMFAEGRKRIVLETDDFRLPALRTYRKLGFVPYLNHESHRARWTAIAEQLDDRPLSEWLASEAE